MDLFTYNGHNKSAKIKSMSFLIKSLEHFSFASRLTPSPFNILLPFNVLSRPLTFFRLLLLPLDRI